MTQSAQRIIQHKVGLLNLAEEIGNVSKACQMMGVSRDAFYKYRSARDEGGVEALFEKSRKRPNPKNRVETQIEQAVLEFAMEYPAFGQVRVSNELRKQGVFVLASGVRRIWLRHTLQSHKLRLKALKSKVAACKLYTTKTPITAADLLNDRVLPLSEHERIELLRVLTDRETKFCGRPERHDYQLFLAIIDIEHTRTMAYSSQTNGICERFHRTIKEEFHEITFRKNVYDSLEVLQSDLDEWFASYNTERVHTGRMCCGRTPIQTFRESRTLCNDKFGQFN